MSTDWIKVFSVVLTGLVVVFLALVILIFAVKLSSFLVRKIENFFSHRKNVRTSSQVSQATKVEQEPSCNGSKEVPTVEDGIDEETVAAITAAITMMGESDGTTYKIKGIKRKNALGMSAWGRTGILENTRAF